MIIHGTPAAGSFNNWEAPIPLGKTTDTGDFVRTIALPAGTYQVRWVLPLCIARQEHMCVLHSTSTWWTGSG